MKKYNPAIYIMASDKNGTLYTGVTNNLIKRVYEHKHLDIKGFTKKYNCKLLVYYEQHSTIIDAISREKQIKGGNRKSKIKLIENINPQWNDLYESLF